MDKNSDTTAVVGDSSVYLAPDAGVVLYTRDGMENLTVDNFTADDFSYSSYKVENLRTSEHISTGSPVYKLITSEQWSILVPVTSFQASKLEGKKSIKVKFKKDI